MSLIVSFFFFEWGFGFFCFVLGENPKGFLRGENERERETERERQRERERERACAKNK